MPPDVRLEEVTADNWRAVVDLELAEEQKAFLASNVYSLAESKFNSLARPRAIYVGDVLVGFLMYESQDVYGKPYETSIYRFMIDKKHQGKGYGRAALEKAIEEIRRLPRVKAISICYMPDNPVRKLYESVGFVPIGCDEDGEVVAELAIPSPAV
jgi:diamine N-acetyltransferase